MGFPTAQASLLNVAADASFNSGVYAIGSSFGIMSVKNYADRFCRFKTKKATYETGIS
jgi:hypothetical protein